MTNFLGQLRAGKVTLQHLIAAARAPDVVEVFADEETTREVLRQLCGHIDQLIAASQGNRDIREGIYDLERRFEVWREGEAQRVRDHLKNAQEVQRLRDDTADLRRLIWDAYETVDDVHREAEEMRDTLAGAELVVDAGDAAKQLMEQVDAIARRLDEVERFVGCVRGAAEEDDE